MFAAGQPYSPFTLSGSGGDLGDGAALGIFKALSGPIRRACWRFALVPLPLSSPRRGWGLGEHCMTTSQQTHHPHPSSPGGQIRQTPRSSWVSGESGNKGKESHFLSRGRKEAESRPASQPGPALGCSPWEGKTLSRTLKPPPSHF